MPVKVIKENSVDMIRCSACRKDLMRINKNEPQGDKILFNIVVECPFCNDKSFQYPLYGPMRNLPADGVQLLKTVSEGSNIMKFLTQKRS